MAVPDSPVNLDRDALESLCAAKCFTDSAGTINSVAYSSTGDSMIISTDDDSIFMYNMITGTKTRNVNSKKYGVGLIRFASAATCAVHCSTKVDNTIRYLSLHDNKYLRYFIGHTDKVTCLAMSPQEDSFLSASLDKNIRLWDLRSNLCQGIMNLNSTAIAAFDPEGLIFAAGMNSEILKLYDLRSFDKGPFTSFTLPKEVDCDWTSMKFSPCGKHIMINTNGNFIRLIDAFSGQIKQTLDGHENSANIPLEATYTPCSNYILCGSSDRKIYCWSVDTGEIVTTLQTTHDSAPQIVSFNPKYFIMASACKKLQFWVPGEDFCEHYKG